MSISNIDDFRSILSDNFGRILKCLAPMAFAGITRLEREDDYLERLAKAALSSRALAKNLVGRFGRCSFEIDGAKTHKRIWVDFLGTSRPCEIGDIMIVSKFVDSLGVLSRKIWTVESLLSLRRSYLGHDPESARNLNV